MEVSKNQVFNLWNTNGRRHDVVNALEIYLRILKDLYSQYPLEIWGAYPKSILQYFFYKNAVQASPDVFKDHPNFDDFDQFLCDKYDSFISRSLQLDSQQKVNLDKNIEQRARHFTSNLVRLGLTDKDRRISQVGTELLTGKAVRDKLEKLLPITDTNLILLRQLLKLRVYSQPNKDGSRYYYSPCLHALYLLLCNSIVDIDYFKHQTQGSSPYWHDRINLKENQIVDIVEFVQNDIVFPQVFLSNTKIKESDFCVHVKNRKSGAVVPVYYTFYSALYEYVQTPSNENYLTLRNILLSSEGTKIEKAFGFGKSIFQCGNKTRPYSQESFLEENANSPLLSENFNKEFYKHYYISKYLDTAREYSDTTVRMLGATGLFKFSKPLVELSHKELFRVVFSHFALKESIFGVVSKEQYGNLISEYFNSISFTKILGFSTDDIENILSDLCLSYGETTDIRSALIDENRINLETHIQEKYPKKKVIELLQQISTRQNDKAIKQYVNEDATIPTIYEFIVAIAWYYISNKQISVYDSLNLTLNGDLEPVIHAAGGAGDIVIRYPEKVVMIEATLMNSSAQKRGEWEPVLRHAINLTAQSYPYKVFTLFVADELDYNTINIWRAVAAVTLKSSSTGTKTEHVIIMPFTNEHLCHFMLHNITDDSIISAIDVSYDEIKTNFDDTWHDRILTSLL